MLCPIRIMSCPFGPLLAYPSALEWRRHSFVFNAGNRTTITFAMASTETGSGGRDFYVDNVETSSCDLGANSGEIRGNIFIDDNGNNAFDPLSEGSLADINVQLWDTRGDGDPSNDIYISNSASLANGEYRFENLAPLSSYEVRVVSADPDLPSGATLGTQASLSAPVIAGGVNTGNDFGFDLAAALLVGEKTVAVYDPLGLGLFAVPGNDVIYTISVTNQGDGSVDANSLLIIDGLPNEVTFYNDNMDAGTSGPVAFSQTGTGLSFSAINDVGYALAGPKPADFTQCTYSSALAGYDPLIRYVCVNPKGVMSGGTPDPSFSISFRARVE